MLKNSRQLSWSSHRLSRPNKLCRVGIRSTRSSDIALIQPHKAATGANKYLFSVVAGILPAVEPGIVPGALGEELDNARPISRARSGRQDAALYGSQDGCRYVCCRAVNTYAHRFAPFH